MPADETSVPVARRGPEPPSTPATDVGAASDTTGAPSTGDDRPDVPADAPVTDRLDRDRLRNFAGLSVARVGPRAFDVVHGTFLTLLVGARTGSAFWTAFALTAHRLFSWLVLPISGRWSDRTRSRLGRRAPFLGGGLIISGVATFAYTIVGGYWPLVGAIFVARVANTGRQIASVAVVPETFGRSRWIRAIIATALAGMVLSLSVRLTVIATWKEADPSTWNISFRMAAAFMVAAGVAVLLLVRDTEPAKQLATREAPKRPVRERIAEVLEVPNARLLLASLFLTVASSGATARLLPLYNREALGAGGAEQSAAAIAAAVLGLMISIPGGVWLSRRISRKTSAVLANVVGAAGAAAHLVLTDLWQSVAVGVFTGLVGVAAVIALASFVLQLLPRSGGMGERVGLAAGPFALIGVLSTYLAAVTVDATGSYRTMWLLPAGFSLANAVLMSRLWVPPWAARVDVWAFMRRQGGARRRRREAADSETGEGRDASSKDRGLFAGEVDVDDVDATVVFEMGRHALGNPYEPPRPAAGDEPALAAVARRVLEARSAASAAEVAATAALLDEDATCIDPEGEHRGQPAVLERLNGPDWTLPANTTWRLVAFATRESEGTASVLFQASPAPHDGEVEVAFEVVDGTVRRIERTVSPGLTQQADAHAASLGFPVPEPVDLSNPDRGTRRRRALLTFWVIGRHGWRLLLKRLFRRPIEPLDVAAAMRPIFERLGAAYVKFGQLVASSPSIFGEQVSEEFRTTLDAAPPAPIGAVRSLISAELGRPFDEVFREFDPVPIGRASVAVVHRAVTMDGQPVAVKVIRPGIEDVFATDLALMEPLMVRLAGPSAARLLGPLLQVLQGFRRQVAEELDLRNEMRAMVHYRQLLTEVDLPDVVVPEPVSELSARRVLTMELLDGVAVDDLTSIESFGVDPAPLVEQAVKAWFMTGVLYGTFHGDVHAGNLMLLRDGRIALIDWGIVARLDPSTHGFFRQLIAGSLGDETAWDEIAAFFAQMLGPLLTRAGMQPSDVVDLVRPRVESVLTRPFGQMSLGALISDNQREAAEAEGEKVSLRDRRRAAREQRDADAAEAGGSVPGKAPPFNRGLFLLGKQLMYFERYGRLYLSDVSILEDRDFFAGLIERSRAE